MIDRRRRLMQGIFGQSGASGGIPLATAAPVPILWPYTAEMARRNPELWAGGRRLGLFNPETNLARALAGLSQTPEMARVLTGLANQNIGALAMPPGFTLGDLLLGELLRQAQATTPPPTTQLPLPPLPVPLPLPPVQTPPPAPPPSSSSSGWWEPGGGWEPSVSGSGVGGGGSSSGGGGGSSGPEPGSAGEWSAPADWDVWSV